ncbi:MAG: ribose 5-phosphate isomerase B [Vallitaleaceae bacterium]|nr:ribose 5-phosphate isomerase B [Vallitaleaceae bacterium]
MIAIASDHGGFELKQEIMAFLDQIGFAYQDYGCESKTSVDYPVYAKSACSAILEGVCDKGILICGTGIGISIAANKIKGIRAALCSDSYTAGVTRLHNDTNVLCLGGRVIGPEVAKNIVQIFLTTEFSNEERHIQRIRQIEEC